MHRRERSPSLARPAHSLLGGVKRIAFWLAIALPAGYAPLLASGLDGRTSALLGALVVCNLVCLLVGHDYSPWFE